MELRIVEEGGVRVAEGQPEEAFMSSVEDVGRLIEACLSIGIDAALLYTDNLPGQFFDLSSGQAGAILQKFRTARNGASDALPPPSLRTGC